MQLNMTRVAWDSTGICIAGARFPGKAEGITQLDAELYILEDRASVVQ